MKILIWQENAFSISQIKLGVGASVPNPQYL